MKKVEQEANTLMSEAIQLGIERCVVGAIIERGGRVLLLRRNFDDFMGGISELPSGKVEDKEELLIALEREILEETSLNIERTVAHIGSFDYASGSGKKTRQFNFFVEADKDLEPVVTPEEHSGFDWVARTEIDEYPITESVKEILEKFWELKK